MYSFDSRIRYSETDSQGQLTLAALLNYFQDCTTFHSEELGVGLEYLGERHLVWLLCAWQIVVERYPRLGEKVEISTIPYEFKGFLGSRNFLMKTKEGECLAKANSLWSHFNMQTGKVMVPAPEAIEGYVLGNPIEMDYAPRKIVIPKGGVREEPIVVRKYHLDTNHHVNNGQFVNMAMSYLPDNFVIRQMRAEYKKQAFLNDVLHPEVAYSDEKVVVALTDAADKPYVTVEFTARV